jgi:peptidoglycan/LPS O-acetylase OafA/YrhL
MVPQAWRESRERVYRRLSVSGAAATDHARWASIDAVRALAALMVLASHGHPLGGPVVPNTTTQRVVGSLAGGMALLRRQRVTDSRPFLRSLLRAEARPPTAAYAVRRAARILPAYWIAFALMLVLVSGAQVLHWYPFGPHARWRPRSRSFTSSPA